MSSKISTLLLSLAISSSLSGCDIEYWWSRGKPPGSKTLFARATESFSEELQSTTRNDVKQDVEKAAADINAVENLLASDKGGAELNDKLNALNETFSKLEGRLSWGQRASYGELSGQISGFQKIAEETGTVDKNVFSLFGARTLFFLANELKSLTPVGYQAEG